MARSKDLNLTAVGPRRWRRRILVRLLAVLGLVLVLFGGAALWLYHALPQIAARELGRWMNARIETGAFYPHRDGSVTVEGLVVRPRLDEPGYENAILRANVVYAKFSRRSLLHLAPRVTALGIEDFLLDVQLNLNTGRWNVGALRINTPPGAGADDVPVVALKRGKLRYCKVSGTQQEVVMSVPIEAHFGPDRDGNPGYTFEIRTAQQAGGYGRSNLTGHWRPSRVDGPGEFTLAGGLSSTDIPSLERAWAIDVLAAALRYDRQGRYTLDVSLKNAHGKHVPEMDMLRFIIPAAAQGPGFVQNLQEMFAEYQPAGIVGSLTLKASGNLKTLPDSIVEGKLVCQDVSLCDRDFPYRLEHVSGPVEFTESSVHANGLVARHGPVAVHLDGWVKEAADQRQYHCQITSHNMVLDQDLYAALRPEHKRFWDAFRPTGTVAVDYRLSRTSPTDKRLYLSVDLNDVTAAFQSFPYPLTGLTGNLFFDLNSLTFSHVVSQTSGRRIEVNGKVTEHADSSPTYHLSVDGKDIPLDVTLRNALPARYREMFRQCDVNGLADIRARVFSTGDPNGTANASSVATPDSATLGPADPNSSRRVRFLADVSCKQGSLKLAALRPAPDPGAAKPTVAPAPVETAPLVLSEITAQATITPDSLSIRKLEGRRGRSRVGLTGGVLFGAGNKLKQCRMTITAQPVPLDETTFALLPPSLARQAAAFRAEGDVDLTVDVKQVDSNEPPEYTATVNCLGDKMNHERFPFPLQDVRGTVTIGKDGITLKNVTATPQHPPSAESTGQSAGGGALGASSSRPPTSLPSPAVSLIRLDGSISDSQGTWQGSFAVRANDLLLQESLGRALPQAWAGPYRELSPQGPVDLDLTTLKVSQAAGGEIAVDLAGQANLKACRLTTPHATLELTGTVTAEGSYSTKQGLTRGRALLAAERLVAEDKAATRTNIEALYDPNTQQWTAANFVGDCYGGRLLGNLEIGPAGDATGPVESSLPKASNGSSVSSTGLMYQLRLALHEVDLQQFLLAGSPEERRQKSEELSGAPAVSRGRMDASLTLRGRLGGARNQGLARQGACHVEIADMQVGKVSPLRSLLAVLHLAESASERMLIDSYVQADKLLISRLDLSDGSTAFTGSGTMDLPTQEVNLTLTARGARETAAGPSVLQSLTEGLGGAVVRVEVTGKAGNPHVQTKTLPVLQDSLKILGTP